MPWKDLAHLETTCEVVIRSYLDADKRLAWRMTVSARSANPPPSSTNGKPLIMTEAADIGEAVSKGVERARKLGLIADEGANFRRQSE